MTKYDKIYRIISIISFILHIYVFSLVTYAGFLPYRETSTTYECFVGFFGEMLRTIQPYAIMGILVVSCIGAFLTIERPQFSFLAFVSSLSFFLIAVFPYSIETMVVGFASPWISASMATYGMGFRIINFASHIVTFDLAFIAYAFVTLIVWATRKN